jgi:hypothetical protein
MPVPPHEPDLTDADMPALFHIADQAARRHQRRYFTLAAEEIVCLALIPTVWVFIQPWVPTFARMLGGEGRDSSVWLWTVPTATVEATGLAVTLPTLLLVAAFIIATLFYIGQTDERWRRSRAIAENVRASVWRYALHAQAGELPASAPGAPHADEAFALAMDVLLAKAEELGLSPLNPSVTQITQRMIEVRAIADQQQACMVYVAGRVKAEQTYYQRRATLFARRCRTLRQVVLVVTLVTIPSLFLHWLSLVPAGAAALGSWFGARQYDIFATNYASLERQLEARAAQGEWLDLSDALGRARLSRFVYEVETLLDGALRTWLVISLSA